MAAAIVFDSSPLNYWARAGCFEVLEQLTSSSARFTTAVVRGELARGVRRHPELQAVLDAPWLGTVGDTPASLSYLARYSALIGRSGRNLGEASVLAWAKAHDAVAFIDDQSGAKLAKREATNASGVSD